MTRPDPVEVIARALRNVSPDGTAEYVADAILSALKDAGLAVVPVSALPKKDDEKGPRHF